MKLPFDENIISDLVSIRTFSEDVNYTDLVWHIDLEDRLIEPLSETDWKFQLDNELPVIIDSEIFIPKKVYHRLIKGTGDLKLKITKII